MKGKEAQTRLSVCRPVGSFEQATTVGGVAKYAHITGDVQFKRRALLQLTSTLGFVLNGRGVAFNHVTPLETAAVHECLTWGRQSDNNPMLRWFGTRGEQFLSDCLKLKSAIRSILPEADLGARIRMSRHGVRGQVDGTLADTIGEEPLGMVVVDQEGCPMKYDKQGVFRSAVATQCCRMEIDTPGPGGKGWQNTGKSLDPATHPDLGGEWIQSMADGLAYLEKETWVPANDPHIDAKVMPHLHPYGTGSLKCEEGAGGEQHYARNRLMLLESGFRRSPEWIFWQLDRLHKTTLFFDERRRQDRGHPAAAPSNTP